MRRGSLLLLLTLLVVSETTSYDNSENAVPGYAVPQFTPYEINEYIRHIASLMNARNEVGTMGDRHSNSQRDTKDKAWKRNADLINSLLSLPKGMYDAGR